MIYVIDKNLKKLPYISTAKAGRFTATFGNAHSFMVIQQIKCFLT